MTTLRPERPADGPMSYEDTGQFRAVVESMNDPLNDPLPGQQPAAAAPVPPAPPAPAAPVPPFEPAGPPGPAGPSGSAGPSAPVTPAAPYGYEHPSPWFQDPESRPDPYQRQPARDFGVPVDAAAGVSADVTMDVPVDVTAALPPLDLPEAPEGPGGLERTARLPAVGGEAGAVPQSPPSPPSDGGRAARRRAAATRQGGGNGHGGHGGGHSGHGGHRARGRGGPGAAGGPGEPAGAAPLSRVEARKAQKAAKDSPGVIISRVVGELFITIGVLMLLFVTYQLWWTNVRAHAQANGAANHLQHEWDAAGQEPNPVAGAFSPGEGFAIMYIPKLDVKAPVAQGVSKTKVLDKGEIGHYDGALNTAMPWDKSGNFAVAAHRNTHGEPFRYINHLVPGDKVVVETENAYYTYVVTSSLASTPPSNTGVLRPIPTGSGFTKPGRYLTLTTCTPEFTSKNRLIVWGKLIEERPRSKGKPAALTEG